MRRFPISLVWLLAAALPAAAQEWRSMGPPGGDVQTLSTDPRDPARLYMGTTDGHIFASVDAGEHWKMLARAGHRRDAVVTSIVVDPRDSKLIFVGTWTQDPGAGGGVFRSRDGGTNWQPAGLVGQAVRALAQAPSDPDILVAGTLEGVFQSRDAGKTWERISPEGDEELRQIDSIAIDPLNPDILYAGTFHLPWKTTDGGLHWSAIHSGMLDDSDVMAIIVDRADPRRIYASACSGIYRSDNAGALWKKIQGIPYTARRSPVIQQDPEHSSTIYAGTTEGLWKSTDAGATWQRVTPRNWVINALALPSSNTDRIVIGTERLGVLVSDDGGTNFRSANDGFNHRQIVALAMDRLQPGRVLAVLANSPEPVLATGDGGRTWAPLGPGLKTEGLLRVYAAPDGWWAALERGGLMRYDAPSGTWVRAGSVVDEAAEPRPLTQLVQDMAFSREIWFAATAEGLLASRDTGATWSLFPVGPMTLPVRSVRCSLDGRQLWVASLRGMLFSQDAGANWSWHDLPFGSGGAQRIEIADEKTLLVLSPTGLFVSRDAGERWELSASGIPQAQVQDLAVIENVFLASMQTGGLYLSTDRGVSWQRIEGTLAEGFFPVVASLGDASVVYAASASEGLYAVELGKQRENVSSDVKAVKQPY